jgi:phosphoenolpyruvate carboxykinase (GTP)
MMPKYEDITWAGLDFSEEKFYGIMDINREGGIKEAEALKEYFASFGDVLPPELEAERKALAESCAKAPEVWSLAKSA